MGRGAQLRRRPVRSGARVGAPERRGLGPRLPRRRPAARRRPRDLRRLGARARSCAELAGARCTRRRPARRMRDRRERAQRSEGDPAARARRLGLRRAVGRRLPPRDPRRCSPASARATTPTSASWRRSRRRSRARSSSTATTRRSRRRRFGAPGRRPSGAPVRRLQRQNHDQVGNRALGDRLPREVRPLAAFCVLLSRSPRCSSWARSTARTRRSSSSATTSTRRSPIATREGRRREFAAFAAFSGEEVPDPQAFETFERSKLTRAADPELAQLYRDLLRVRRELRSGRRRRVSSWTRSPAACASTAATTRC